MNQTKDELKADRVQPEELLAWEVPHRVQLQNGEWSWRPLYWGKGTEAQIKVIREEKVDPFYPNRRLVVVWPLTRGRASKGMSGTLEGWIKRQER